MNEMKSLSYEIDEKNVKWKIDELLPVGLVIQQIDNLLKE